jgi:hypothetical protein
VNRKILGLLALALIAGPTAANAQLLYNNEEESSEGTADPLISVTTPPSLITFQACPASAPLPCAGSASAQTLYSVAFTGNSVNESLQLNSTNGPLFNTFASLFDGQNVISFGTLYQVTNNNPGLDVTGVPYTSFGADMPNWLLPNLTTPGAPPISSIDFEYSFTYTSPLPGSSTGWDVSASYSLTACATTSDCHPAAAPEIDPASTASGLTLLLGSLIVLRGRRSVKVDNAAV